MKKPANVLGIAPWIAGVLAAAYVTGAIAIHLYGPVNFLFWLRELPLIPRKCLSILYVDWIIWFY